MTGVAPDANDFLSWLLAALRSAPGGNSHLISSLLIDGRLRLTGLSSPRGPDRVDEIVARLAVLAQTKGTPVLFVLPDDAPTRPVSMLATLLLAYWWDRRQAGGLGTQPILYLGTDIGIREDLRHATVRDLGLQLAETLGQTDLGRASRSTVGGRRATKGAGLPSVLTAYSPADPVDLVRRYAPPFVVVDLGYKPDAPWVAPLVRETRARGTPTVMWAMSSFTSLDHLEHADPLVVMLPRLGAPTISSPSVFATTDVKPMILGGGVAAAFAGALRRAVRSLAKSSAVVDGNPEQWRRSGVAGDALALHWRLLRTLELMPCPLEVHEAQVGSHWGLASVAELSEACRRFRDACKKTYPVVAEALAEAAAAIDDAIGVLGQTNPMWDALSLLAVDGAGAGLDLVFGSRGRRGLFLDSMLASYAITLEDLRSIGVHLHTLSEIEAQPAGEWASPGSLGRQTHIVGGLGRSDERHLDAVMTRRSLGVLIYPHQASRLQSTIRTWAISRAFDPLTLARLAPIDVSAPPAVPDRATIEDSFVVEHVEEEGTHPFSLATWTDLDSESELTRLLGLNRGPVDSDGDGSDPWLPDGDVDRHADREDLVCDTALKVRFEGGWTGLYAPDEDLMFVRSLGNRVRTESRAASQLRPGTEIVAIHGQRRQSLYTLLVDRLHRNPVIALQLALVREWQRELAANYRIWSDTTGSDLDDLVAALRSRGSQITSTLAVRFWLTAQTLAPQDPDDVRRAAELLSMEFTQKHHRRISAAASRLRGLHRGLSNRLTNWLEREAGGTGTNEDDLIDPELGIQFSDFANTFLRLKVLAVESRQGPFLRSRLGYLEHEQLDG